MILSKLIKHNCELSGGTFSENGCECPIEEDLGQTQEEMYNKKTGYCRTTHGGPGGEAFKASVGMPYGDYSFWENIVRLSCEKTHGKWINARCECLRGVYDKSTGACISMD